MTRTRAVVVASCGGVQLALVLVTPPAIGFQVTPSSGDHQTLAFVPIHPGGNDHRIRYGRPNTTCSPPFGAITACRTTCNGVVLEKPRPSAKSPTTTTGGGFASESVLATVFRSNSSTMSGMPLPS